MEELQELGVQMITSLQAAKVIETRQPQGQFCVIDNGLYIAIDNSTGDAWTEEFYELLQCIKYFLGEDR